MPLLITKTIYFNWFSHHFSLPKSILHLYVRVPPRIAWGKLNSMRSGVGYFWFFLVKSGSRFFPKLWLWWHRINRRPCYTTEPHTSTPEEWLVRQFWMTKQDVGWNFLQSASDPCILAASGGEKIKSWHV